MRRLAYTVIFGILLLGFFSSVNIETNTSPFLSTALAQGTINLANYEYLLEANNPTTGQPLVVAQILRYKKNGLYRYRPLLIITNEFGLQSFYTLTNATWRQLNNGKIRTNFYAGSNIELIVEGTTFEQHTSATLFVNGRATNFTNVTEVSTFSSGYYWTDQSKIFNEAFTCPVKGVPTGCPGIIF